MVRNNSGDGSETIASLHEDEGIGKRDNFGAEEVFFMTSVQRLLTAPTLSWLEL